jgi:hypothetical protein
MLAPRPPGSALAAVSISLLLATVPGRGRAQDATEALLADTGCPREDEFEAWIHSSTREDWGQSDVSFDLTVVEDGYSISSVAVNGRSHDVDYVGSSCRDVVQRAARFAREQLDAQGPSIAIGVLPFFDAGSTLSATGGARISFTLDFVRASLVVLADFTLPGRGDITDSGGTVTTFAFDAGVLGCGRLARDVHINVCGGVLAGGVIASVQGLATSYESVPFSLTLDASVSWEIALIEHVSAAAMAELLIPIVRPTFDVPAYGVVDPTEPVAGRFGAGVIFRL